MASEGSASTNKSAQNQKAYVGDAPPAIVAVVSSRLMRSRVAAARAGAGLFRTYFYSL